MGEILDTFDQVKFENVMNIIRFKDLVYGNDGFKYVYIAKDGSDVIFSRYEDDSLEEDYIEQQGGSFNENQQLYKFYKDSLNPTQVGKGNDSQKGKSPKTNQQTKNKEQIKNKGKKNSNISGNGLYEELE